VANGYGDLSEFSSAGAAMSGSGGFTGGGLNGPVGIGIDGAGNVWVANSIGALSEFNSSGTAISGSNGYEAASLDSPVALAIDGSGNVWVTNFDASAGVTEFVGAAAPVVTPMAANLQSPYGAHAVNRP
jgi:streptogramin lyase